MRSLARGYTASCIASLGAYANGPKVEDDIKLRAIGMLLDRGWGKPTVTIEGNVEHTTYVLRAPTPTESDDEWLRLHAPSDSRQLQTTDD